MFFHRADKVERVLRRGDTGWLRQQLAKGADPVAFYDRARALKKPHPKCLDLLEQEIEDLAMIPGDHVPRHHDWKIKR